MNRLMEKTVFSGLVMAWRLATWPTSRSPLLVNPTTDGVVRVPSWLAMTVGCPASITATQEFVVPRSIPMIFPILQNPPQIALLNIRSGGAVALERCFSTSPLCNFSVILSSFIAGRERDPGGSEAIPDEYPAVESQLPPSLCIVMRYPVKYGANRVPCECQRSGSMGSHGCSGLPFQPAGRPLRGATAPRAPERLPPHGETNPIPPVER